MPEIDWTDIQEGFKPLPNVLHSNPYDEDGYCDYCGNGNWKLHAPWCAWADKKGI